MDWSAIIPAIALLGGLGGIGAVVGSIWKIVSDRSELRVLDQVTTIREKVEPNSKAQQFLSETEQHLALRVMLKHTRERTWAVVLAVYLASMGLGFGAGFGGALLKEMGGALEPVGIALSVYGILILLLSLFFQLLVLIYLLAVVNPLTRSNRRKRKVMTAIESAMAGDSFDDVYDATLVAVHQVGGTVRRSEILRQADRVSRDVPGASPQLRL